MAEANIELNVTGNASQQLQQVQKNLAGVSTTAEKVSGSIGGLSGAMARLGGVLAGLQIGSYVAKMFEMADAVTDLSAATGVGIAEIKSLRDAFEANGGSAEDVSKMIRTLSKNIYEARDASSEAGKTLKAFGISQGEIAKGDTTEILRKLIDRFAGMEDGAAKTALQMKLFGKSMTEVDFTGVNQGLDDMIAKNKELEPTLSDMGEIFDNVGKISRDFQNNLMKDSSPFTKALKEITSNTQEIADVLTGAVKVVTAFGIAWATTRGALIAQNAVMTTFATIAKGGIAAAIQNTAMKMNEAAATARATAAKVADTTATVANTGATVANTAATSANAAAQVANAAATTAGGVAAAKTMTTMKGLQTILLGPALANTVGFWGRFKAIILGVAGAFGILQTSQTGAIAKGMKSTAQLAGMAKVVQLLKNAWLGVSQVLMGTFGIVFRVLRIFLRFGNVVLIIWSVFDVFNSLVKLITGSSLIEWFDRLIQKMFGFSIVKWAGAQIDWLWGKIKQFVKWLTGVDLSSKTVPTDTNAPPPPPPPGGTNPPPNVPTGRTGGGGGGGGRSQADINKDLKKSIEDITKSYKDQSIQRLKNLGFEVSILGLSEDQRELETAKKEILDQQNETLKQLDQQEADIKANSELTAASRKKNLDLVAQQRVAVQAQASEELAATDALIKKKQEYALLQEKLNNELALQQLAMDNKKALTDLEEQLSLVGLYGDALEDANLKLQVQDELQGKLLDIEKKKLELERNRTQLGEARFAQEMANLAALSSAAQAYANDRLTAEQKLVAAQRKTERTDVKYSIGKRMEELARSVDPAITAVESLNSVFDNMGRAIDNFVDTGKFKFGDFARSVIADIAKIALKAAATKILTSVFGGIFGKAAGGPVMANKPYLVGEQGPELFVPNSAGSIMTNASMNKNVGQGGGAQPVVNNTYITNNISAIDSRSVAQMFVENRKSLLGAATMARKELPYG